MTICISNNSIVFGQYTLTVTDEGFSFPGNISFTRSLINNELGSVGDTAVYAIGGNVPVTSSTQISRVLFSSDTNAATVGQHSRGVWQAAPAESSTHGYLLGGEGPGTNVSQTSKFSFGASATSSPVGSLTQGRQAGSGSTSLTHGYAAGGNPSTASNVIDKTPFSSDSPATDVGDLTIGLTSGAGFGACSTGFKLGGSPGSGWSTCMQSWPFSSDTNATNIGTLITSSPQYTGLNNVNGGGMDSYTGFGYMVTRREPQIAHVLKFPYTATSGNATTSVGDLDGTPGVVLEQQGSKGGSSSSHGYQVGINYQGNNSHNCVYKFPFANETPGTAVGQLSVVSEYLTVVSD